MHYSPSTNGFYLPEIHGANIPTDAVGITAERHAELIAGQAAGQLITAGLDGAPVLADPPPALPPVVYEVSRFQARAALFNAGLLPQVEAAVAAAPPLVQMAWADAITFRRDSPSIAALSATLGMTDAQIDELFSAAALIRA